MNIIQKKLHLITYGNGNKFDIAKFKPIRNKNFVKPHGGLWASPINSKHGWHDWCKNEEYDGIGNSFFIYWFIGNILVIDNLKHAKEMPWRSCTILQEWPDFEKIANLGVDAIHLTEKGEIETRFSNPSLYGWDCECVLIINPNGIIEKNEND